MQQQTSPFQIAVAPDYQKTLTRLQDAYGITFASENVHQYDEQGSFKAVTDNVAQLSICYSTDPLIARDHFVRLIDDKAKLLVDSPSPLLRNETLEKEPRIAMTLNRLAPKLTTDVSIQLQQQVLDGRSAHDVAEQWLKDQGLL
jgi:osmoprotectant transport system substrate-binding protein